MQMARTVADGMWDMLVSAGVRRCYGIVGDALNPVIDALRRNGSVGLIHVRNEEDGVFAAVAEARLTGGPVAVCGTAGPGVAHLINGLIDARRERVPVIAIAGDVESSLIDSDALEELNPYKFFDTAALYIGRLINPEQLRPMLSTAITTAVAERGPVVISLPGDVAVADAPSVSLRVPLPATTIGAASAADLAAMAGLINQADTVAIFGGDGCAEAQDDVRELAARLKGAGRLQLQGQAVAGARQPQRGRHDRTARVRRLPRRDQQRRCAADARNRLPLHRVPAAQEGEDHPGRPRAGKDRPPCSAGAISTMITSCASMSRRPSAGGDGSGTMSPRDLASSRSGPSTSPPPCPSWLTMTRFSPWTPARPASGPPGTSNTAATAGCSARSAGLPWPPRRRTPPVPRFPSPGGRSSRCAAMAASPCSGLATC